MNYRDCRSIICACFLIFCFSTGLGIQLIRLFQPRRRGDLSPPPPPPVSWTGFNETISYVDEGEVCEGEDLYEWACCGRGGRGGREDPPSLYIRAHLQEVMENIQREGGRRRGRGRTILGRSYQYCRGGSPPPSPPWNQSTVLCRSGVTGEDLWYKLETGSPLDWVSLWGTLIQCGIPAGIGIDYSEGIVWIRGEEREGGQLEVCTNFRDISTIFPLRILVREVFSDLRYTDRVCMHLSFWNFVAGEGGGDDWQNGLEDRLRRYLTVMDSSLAEIGSEESCIERVLRHYPVTFCEEIQKRIVYFPKAEDSARDIFQQIISSAYPTTTTTTTQSPISAILDTPCVPPHFGWKDVEWERQQSPFLSRIPLIPFPPMSEDIPSYDDEKRRIHIPLGYYIEKRFSIFYDRVSQLGTLGFVFAHELAHSISHDESASDVESRQIQADRIALRWLRTLIHRDGEEEEERRLQLTIATMLCREFPRISKRRILALGNKIP